MDESPEMISPNKLSVMGFSQVLGANKGRLTN